jgi:dihydroflavonol-4-reductase
MKIFITGGTGFIGKYVVKQLLDQGHELVLAVRPSSNVEGLQHERIQLAQVSLFDRCALQKLMSGCDCLIHLANVYSFWEKDASIYERVNVNATRVVYESALHAGVKKVVHVCTAVMWGNAQQPYNEETQIGEKVFSKYAASKRKMDEMAWQCFNEHGLPLVGVYPAAVIGPGDVKSSGQMVADIMHGNLPARGLENSRITFVDVRDAADGIVKIAEHKDLVGERFILGNKAISLKDYMRHISEAAGVKLPLIKLPNWGLWLVSGLLTVLSAMTKRSPLWGMSLDQTRTFMNGFQCDGSKAVEKLGVHYRPVRESLTDAVRWLQYRDRL